MLRLEDIDPGRCRPELAEAIQEDLSWLGLDWDGPVRVQSRHLADYRAVLDTLAEQGLVYPCFCTRADVVREVSASAAAPHGPDGAPLYPGTCRRLAPSERADRIAGGERFALRLDMAVYAHHRLLADADGRRLAKRDRALTLRSLRDSGVSPRAILDGFV